jgi:DNA polymerase-3 subunit delta'
MNELSISGHSLALDRLVAALGSGRLAHAFLFCGPSGVGKFRTAVALATTFLCGKSEGLSHCGACDTCLALARGMNRNFHLLDAATRTVSLLPPIAEAVSAESTRSRPERTSTFAGGAFIELVREMIGELALKPLDGMRRAIVCRDVELMSEEAFNAFLKTLEEPPAATLMILVTSRPDLLPETVVSRCQVVRFGALAESEVRKVLENVLGKSGLAGHAPARVALAVALAGGSPGTALKLLEGDLMDQRAEFLNSVLGGPGGLLDMPTMDLLLERWKRTAKESEAMRQRVSDAARFLASILRDCLRNKEQGARSREHEGEKTGRRARTADSLDVPRVVNTDFREWIERASAQLCADVLLSTLDKLLDVEADIGRNLRPDLALNFACGDMAWP